MRFIAFITVILVFSSCSSLKPAVNKQPESAGTQNTRSSSPQFIEHITVNGSSTGNSRTMANTAKPAENNAPSYAATGNSNIENLASLQFKYSVLVDAPVEQLNNIRLWQYIDDWYGAHYRFGGNTKQGIDCSAFAGGLMSAVFGIGLPRMAKDQYHTGERVPKDDLQEGDLVFFHTTRKGVSHVGVYLTNNKFVHASTNYGVVISDLNDPYYSRAFVGARRERGDSAAN
jgi:lipoprotein Spr